MIPSQLCGFQFIRVEAGEKRPIEKQWSQHGLAFGDPGLARWIDSGGNYGVLGSKIHCIIDADNPKVSEAIETEFPATFTVLTGSGKGKHYYFECACSKNYKFYDPKYAQNREMRRQLNRELRGFQKKARMEEDLSQEEQDRKAWLEHELESWGEVQTVGKMVVGPGCLHPSGGTYTVIKSVPVARITEVMILTTFEPLIVKREEYVKRPRDPAKTPIDIAIDDVISLSGLTNMGNGEYQGTHPIHGSTTGMNFAVNVHKGIFHCFRCNSGGNALYWLAVEEGILDCLDCAPGALRGEGFRKVLDIAKARGLVEDTGCSSESSDPKLYNISALDKY
jgi:hypothetical protein